MDEADIIVGQNSKKFDIKKLKEKGDAKVKKLLILAFLCNYKLIVCNTICQQDGDALGLLINEECFCANPRDVTKLNIKVPSGKGTYIKDKKTFSWSIE